MEKLTGLQLDGYTHMVDASAIKHTLNRHGGASEQKHGQIPVGKSDFEMIPLVIANPDRVSYAGKTDLGLDGIRYEKEVEGTIVLIEEVRTGQKKLAVITLQKIKKGIGDPKPTSEPFPAPKAGAYDATDTEILAGESSALGTMSGTSTRLPHAENPLNETLPDAGGIVNPDETFDQETRGKKRGEVQLYRADAEHRQAAVIRIFENADFSTVMHELSHVFLADIRDYVETGNADAATVSDYRKLTVAAGDLRKTENFEQVARWFEEYLLEGKAPTVDLIKPFGLFSRWINNVYPDIRGYVGEKMNPETRGIFDRWFASQRDIAEVEAYYAGLNSNEFAKLIDDDDEREKLVEKMENNRQRVANRAAGEMAKAWTNANASREMLTRQAREEVQNAPVYRAIAEAKRLGINRSDAEAAVGLGTVMKIVDMHGDIFNREVEPISLKSELRKQGYTEKDPVAAFIQDLAKAPTVAEAVQAKGSQGRKTRYYDALEVIRRAGGITQEALPDLDAGTLAALSKHEGLFRGDSRDNMDRIAIDNAFDNPSEMLEAMAKANPESVVVRRLTERKVREKAKEARAWAEQNMASINDDTNTNGQAALHDPDNDIVGSTIEDQRKVLQDAIEGAQRRRKLFLGKRTMEEAARQELYKRPLREAMNINNYAAAERKRSGMAAEAARRGDKKAALEALDKQQKFHALTTEAFRIRKDYDAFMRRYGKRLARSEMKTIEDGYRDTIRDILVWAGIVVDKNGTFAPENSSPDRLILPQAVRDGFDDAGNNADSTYNPSTDYYDPALETVIPRWIQEKRLPQGYLGNVLDLNPAQIYDIDQSIKALLKRGRGDLKALRDGEATRISDLVDELKKVLEEAPDAKHREPDKSKRDALAVGLGSYFRSASTVDRLASEAGGYSLQQGKGFSLFERLVDKVRDGEVAAAVAVESFKNATDQDIRQLTRFRDRLQREHGKFFIPEGVRSPQELTGNVNYYREFDADMIISMMLNAGSKGNLHALRKGFNLSEAEMAKIFSLGTREDWLAVQNVGREIGGFFDQIDAVHFRLTNRRLERVQPQPITVTTAEGTDLDLDGWYYPLVYDPKLNDRAAKNSEAAEYRAAMNAIFSPQTLEDGFKNKRVVDEDGNPAVTYAPLLETGVLFRHLNNVTRWIHMSEAIMEFRRVTMDKSFRELFIKKLGNNAYRELREWTNYQARPNQGENSSLNRGLSKLRNMSTVVGLGLNVRSSIKQLSSVGLAADDMSKASGGKAVGWAYIARGLYNIGLRGATYRFVKPIAKIPGLSPFIWTSPQIQEMYDISPQQRHRAERVNQEMSDAMANLKPIQGKITRNFRKIRDLLFHFTISVDNMVSSSVWWGSVAQFEDGKAGVDISKMSAAEKRKEAVRYADRIVRSQQSPYAADASAFQRDKGAIRLLTSFMGGLTPYVNSTYINVQLAKRLGWKHAIPLATHLTNVYVLPAIGLTTLFLEGWAAMSGDRPEEDEYIWGSLEEFFGLATGGLPLARDVNRFALKKIKTGQDDWRSALPPALSLPYSVVSKTLGAADKYTEGDAYAAGKDMGMLVAEMFGFSAPIRQGKKLGQAFEWIDED